MQGYDIIGDVHGCASMLVDRLVGMGYTRRGGSGTYTHPDYHAVFVGDLIDRGPQQLETLEVVKAMVDANSASIVMGNHEFNAVAYATEHPEFPDHCLRRHTDKNTSQHQAFLDQLTQSQRKYYVDWFKTLPLWLSLPSMDDNGRGKQLRVVHACWHPESMDVVRKACGGDRISTVDQWALATDGRSDLYKAVEVLLKGPEIALAPYGVPGYTDKDGHPRDRARLCWWRESATKLSELTELAKFNGVGSDRDANGNDIEIKGEDRSYVYDDTIPVFYGHYWREDVPTHLDDFTSHTACVDFSAVNSKRGGGTLVAYRWAGESEINEEHYIPHGSAHRAYR